MLASVLLVLTIALIAGAAGGVIWLVVDGFLDPLVATLGSLGVLVACTVTLALLAARRRTRTKARERRNALRSQVPTKREPARYDDEIGPVAGTAADAPGPREDSGDDAQDEVATRDPDVSSRAEPASGELSPGESSSDEAVEAPPLDMPVPEASPYDEALSLAVRAAARDGVIETFLAPIIRMPEGEVEGSVVRAGMPNADRPMDEATIARLDPDASARLAAATLDALLNDETSGAGALHVAIPDALLDDREAFDAVRAGMAEAEAAGRLVLHRRSDDVDVLRAGRIAELRRTGAGLALDVAEPGALGRADAAEIAAAEPALVAAPAPALRREPTAARGVRRLVEAEVAVLAEGVETEEEMLDLGELGVTRFSGPLAGRFRRIERSDDGGDEGGDDEGDVSPDAGSAAAPLAGAAEIEGGARTVPSLARIA